MAIGAVVVAASGFLPAGPRLWAGFCVAWLLGMVAIGHSAVIYNEGPPPTDSLVERFGLFTIIFLVLSLLWFFAITRFLRTHAGSGG